MSKGLEKSGGKPINTQKKKKKWIIIAGVLIVIVIVGTSITNQIKNAQTAIQNVGTVTDTVTSRNLVQSISATGSFESGLRIEESAYLANVKVNNVNVQVGDSVKVGDVLCSFDVSDIAHSADSAQKTLDTANAQNEISISSAQRQLDSAKASQSENSDTVNRNNTNAKKTYEDARVAAKEADQQVSDAKNKVSDAKVMSDTAKKTYDDAKVISDDAQKLYETAKTALEDAKTQRDQIQKEHDDGFAAGDALHDQKEVVSCSNCQATYNAAVLAVTNAQTACDAAELDYNNKNATTVTALSTYSAADADYEAAKKELTAAQSAADTANQQADSAYFTYQGTLAQGQTTKRTDSEQVQAQADSVENAKLTAQSSTITQEEQLENYNEQLAQGNLVATQSGVITSVNVTAGSTYTGGNVVTIQDDEQLQITTEVGEYDIADLKEGMKVLIKTDATKNEELTGTIASISPVATANAASIDGSASTTASGSSTYTVKISLDQQNERLRLGMTAKLSIIQNQKENVLTVPYNAVHQDTAGNSFVTLSKADGTTEEVQVTVGMESDYYTEISGEGIQEGAQIVLQSVGDTSIQDMINNQSGGMGGF